jgi:hypothetical protein
MTAETVRFGYSVVASGLHDTAVVAELTAPVRSMLESIGGVQVDPAATAPTPLRYGGSSSATNR